MSVSLQSEMFLFWSSGDIDEAILLGGALFVREAEGDNVLAQLAPNLCWTLCVCVCVCVCACTCACVCVGARARVRVLAYVKGLLEECFSIRFRACSCV